MKKKASFLLIIMISMIILLIPTVAFASESGEAIKNQGNISAFSDMPNDWSKAALEKAVDNGLLTGYNGQIMAKNNLTRAQMAAIINRAFGANKEASLEGFTDVSKDAWYYNDMAMAVQMRTLIGNGGGKLEPNTDITREQAFSILARAFKLSGADESVLDKFPDSGSISDWAKDSVASLVQAGYISGSEGKLNSQKYITRAEFAQLMDNMLKHYINHAGTYSEIQDGNIMINIPGVTLKDITVTGDLIIGDGVGDGEVILDSVNVKGRTVIRGGGQNSIKIIGNSNAGTVIVARFDGVVSVKVQGDAQVGLIYIDDGSDDVILVGPFGNIKLNADDVTVTAIDASINEVQISGNDSRVIVGEGSDIRSFCITGRNANISGTGTVRKVDVLSGGDNTSITTPNTQITVGKGVDNVTGGGGESIQSGVGGVNNQRGTALVKDEYNDHSSSSPSIVNIEDIGTISGTATVGEMLTCGALTPSDATATYQWLVSGMEEGEYTDIVGETGTTLNIPEGYAGKFIKVKATGNNNFVGTVISAATPAINAAEFSITVSADGDVYMNGAEATDSAAITVTPANGILSLVEIRGVDKSDDLTLTVSATLNDATGNYEFDATTFMDGTLTVIGTNSDSVKSEATLTLDTRADKLFTGGNLVELTEDNNPLSVVQVYNWAFPASGDLNGDSRLDVVVGDMAGHIKTYYQQSDGTYEAARGSDRLSSIELIYDDYVFPGLGDLDGDGDLDLLVSWESGDVQYYKNTGTFETPAFTIQDGDDNPFKAVFNPYYAFNAVGDVDADGDADVLFGYGDSEGSQSLELWKNDGSGAFTKYDDSDSWFNNYSKANGYEFIIPYIGDFNGDGKLDAAVFGPLDKESRTIAFYQGYGGGTYELNEDSNPFAGISFNVPFASAGDIDGDGDADFLIGDTGGVIRCFQNNVGEAVKLADSQIVSGLGSGNVTTYDTEYLIMSGKGAESLANISIYVDGNLLTNDIQADASGEWNHTWLGTEEGFEIVRWESYAITVEQTDVAGNVSDISNSYIINIKEMK